MAKKTTESDLLFQMYQIAIVNDPSQEILITVCRRLRELGYKVEDPEPPAGIDSRFTQPQQGRVVRRNRYTGFVPDQYELAS